MSNETVVLQAWFKNTHHVNVSHDWILKSVNELRRKSSQDLTLNNIRQTVWTSWLNSDLNLNPNSCLPQDVTTREKQILNGNYVLQVEEIKDISQSGYSQLMKIANQNVNNSDELPDFEARWKPKATRMMWLTLTDGIEIVMGMEYQHIPALNSSIYPGTKILIFGATQCRYGVIFLTKDNVKIVGGVVESLKEKNSTVNVITKSLGSENLSKLMKDSQVSKKQITGNNNGFSTVKLDEINDFPDDDDIIDLDEIERLENSATEFRQFISNNKSSLRNNDTSATISKASTNKSSNNISNENRNDRANCFKKQTNSTISSSKSTLPQNVDDDNSMLVDIPDEVWDDFDDDFTDFADTPSEKPEQRTDLVKPSSITMCSPKLSTLPPLKQCQQTVEMESTKKSDSFQLSREKTIPLDVEMPFVYIEDILKIPKFSRKSYYTIRGFITTLTSSLEHKGITWSLKAIINDGSASLNVILDNKFLEELIGIKANELGELAKKAKINKEYHKFITNGLKQCQEYLTNFSGLFEVQFLPDAEPRIVSSRQLTSEEVKILHLLVDDSLLPFPLGKKTS